MRTNALLMWILLPVVAVLAIVGIRMMSGTDNTARPPLAGGIAAPLTPGETKALGIGADTPQDTVATLVAQVKELRQEVQATVKENKERRAENERLRQSDRAIDQRIQAALTAERERLAMEQEKRSDEHESTRTLLEELKRKIDGTHRQPAASPLDLPVGLGLYDDEPQGSAGETLRWVEPDDVPATSATTPDARRSPKGAQKRREETSFRSVTDSAELVAHDATNAVRDADILPTSLVGAKPVYTIPANATLMGSVAMTALIGRIPVSGTVHDAYPFKVIIGAQNLTANGIELPEVAGAIVSGSASGDRTLSCVRGQIRSITFVFNDGTVRTISSTAARGEMRATDEGLGWISDPYGTPCVSGELRSNAQQYLTTQSLITAAGAGAAALIKSDNGSATFVTGNGGNVVGTVGISGSEAMGRILANGVQEMSEWVNKVYGEAFAAIYVRPGAPVAVHIEQALAIDYEPHGRKVNHSIGARDEPDLD